MARTKGNAQKGTYRRLVVLNAVEFLIVPRYMNGGVMWKFNIATNERTAIEIKSIDDANAELVSLVQRDMDRPASSAKYHFHSYVTGLTKVAEQTRTVQIFKNHPFNPSHFRTSKAFQIGSKTYHFDNINVRRAHYSVIDKVKRGHIKFFKMMDDTDCTKHWTLCSEYITSRNSILVYGDRANRDKIADWTHRSFDYSGHFAEFPINKQEFDAPIYWDSPISIRAAVMMGTTKDGRYLIMIGLSKRLRPEQYEQYLFVFDLNLKMLKLKRQMNHRYDGGLMMNNEPLRDELLACGFVRGTFGKRKFQSTPICLIKLIGKWYCNECIYLMKSRSNELEEMIEVDDIIKNALGMNN